MAEGLLKAGAASRTVADLLDGRATPGLEPIRPGGRPWRAAASLPPAPARCGTGRGGGRGGRRAADGGAGAGSAEEEEDDDWLAMEPYIETARCTTCNECTNLNAKMFAYNDEQAGVHQGPEGRDLRPDRPGGGALPGGDHPPRDPLNPKEKDLEKWVKRAEPFN